MKKIVTLLVITFLYTSCITSEMTSNAIGFAIVGESEMDVYYRLGSPTRIIPTPDGGKIMRYEWQNNGMLYTPSTSKTTSNYSGNVSKPYNPYGGVNYSGTINSTTTTPSYTPYQSSSYLEAYLNKQGKCVTFKYKMPQYQLEQFYKRFKGYIPKDYRK